MWKDPIVEEVRHAREELASRFSFDIKAIVEDARQRQTKSRHRVVSFANDRKTKTEKVKSSN